MNPNTIYRKTAKGSEAIAARLHGLVGRSRSLLILVDGKRKSSDLLQVGAGFGDVGQMLSQLLADGFIEPLPGSQEAPVSTVAKPPSLAEAKAFTSRRLIEILGPNSEQLCLKIEAARDLADFVAAVKRAYTIVREVRGGAEAERFGNAVEANLPPR